jgi:hypothetical protein
MLRQHQKLLPLRQLQNLPLRPLQNLLSQHLLLLPLPLPRLAQEK